MKNQIVKIAAVVAILFGGIASLTAQEIQIPFTEKKYKSDENYFRASSYGKVLTWPLRRVLPSPTPRKFWQV